MTVVRQKALEALAPEVGCGDKAALSDAARALSTDHAAVDVSEREAAFAPTLIAWQRQYGRHDLPWQNTRDAYRIWLSEIMLQQTQVSSVVPYYQRFLQKFPDNAALAAAPQEEVLALWAGLGYYARARNLHRCAQVVVRQHGGCFPTAADTLIALPGIGRSTAAAIAAFSVGQRVAILDGNVKRVLTRCFGIEGFPGEAAIERGLWVLAERLLPAGEVEAYTQGLMDLGASLCSRSKPRCGACPMADFCVAHQQGRAAELPTRKPKKATPQRCSEVLLLVASGAVLLEVRPPAGLWGGLWTLPEIPAGQAPLAAARDLGCSPVALKVLPTLRHTFTHFKLDLVAHCGAVVAAKQASALHEDDSLRWLPLAAIETAPLPAPILKLLRGVRDAASPTA